MTPAFGFSVGDFISAISLVKKVSKALKESGGAAAEYQQVVIELEGLKNVLQQLETFEPTEENTRHVNAIRGMALACQLPLRGFMIKLEKYEASLGPFADQKTFRGVGRKARWATAFSADVEKLRAMVAAKNTSINLLLAMQSSQSLSRIEARGKKEHTDLMTKVAEHRAALEQVQHRLIDIKQNMTNADQAYNARLNAISDKVGETQRSLLSLRGIGEQISALLKSFPLEMRDLLRAILQSNWHIYEILLQVQRNLPKSPTGLLDSNIKFEDAMGDRRELPYDIFRHWEPFEGYLRAQFKDKLGEDKIIDGKFHIIDVKNRNVILRKEHWTRSIRQGATLTMSMVMSHLQRRSGTCPRSKCPGVGLVIDTLSSVLACDSCGLKFYSKEDDLDEKLSQATILDEEDRIAMQQVEEDLRLYGCRFKPTDVAGVDEDIQFPPRKRTASNFEAVVDRPPKIRKNNPEKDYKDGVVTVMDWNAGESPLSAWLNQSAIPSAVPTLNDLQDQTAVALGLDPLEREMNEIEVFRNVHMATAPEPAYQIAASTQDNILDLELSAQIYYRNIVDRYPLLPVYLARRLAIANNGRAKRLERERWNFRFERRRLQRQRFEAQAKHNTAAALDHKVSQKPSKFFCADTLSEALLAEFTDPLLSSPNAAKRPAAVANANIIGQKAKSIPPKDSKGIYPCSHCPQIFTEKEHLISHLRNTGLLPYTCRLCMVTFSRSDILKNSIQTYSIEKGILTRESYFSSCTADRSDLPSWNRTPTELYYHKFYEPYPDGSRSVEKGILIGESYASAYTADRSDLPGWNRTPTEISQHEFYEPYPDTSRAKAPPASTSGQNRHRKGSLDNKRPERMQSAWSSRQMDARPVAHRNGFPTTPSDTQSDFWTGGISSPRPGSVDSRSSSMNSSLHGSARFDPEDQNPSFGTLHERSGSADWGDSSRGLPPPPVMLPFMNDQSNNDVYLSIQKSHKAFAIPVEKSATPLKHRDSESCDVKGPASLNTTNRCFECDICGQTVMVHRRLEWQKHVMSDLQPYVCTFTECNLACDTFPSLSGYLSHEIQTHELEALHGVSLSDRFDWKAMVRKLRNASVVCLFCGERTAEGNGHNSRGRHVGRHMEEIAFTVVSKPYEEWEFYSDSSSAHSAQSQDIVMDKSDDMEGGQMLRVTT